MSSQSGSSFGQTAYTGVATYGRFQAATGAVFGVIIAVVLVIIGASRLRDVHVASAPMLVTGVAQCTAVTQTNTQQSGVVTTSTRYACVVTVQYTANLCSGSKCVASAQTYTVPNVPVSASSPVLVGSSLQLRYDPRNPLDVVQEVSPRALGWGLIGGGVLVGAIAVGAAVLSFKSKEFAAVEGTAGLIGALRR